MTEPRISPASIDTEPLCVDASGLATLLLISERQVHRLDSGGKVPAPIVLGRCKRWSVDEVKAWVAAGAPPRSRWNATRNLERALGPDRGREQGQ